MAFNTNNHIGRLNRFLPFDASHDQIYEEYQITEDSLNLNTQALQYTLDAISGNARLIILTGDAGHGKTHLCRRVIQEHLGYSEPDARKLINTKCDGKSTITHQDGELGNKRLRIFKDFSELEVDHAAKTINDLEHDSEAVTLICANEGRLRDVLSSSNEQSFCSTLLKDFNHSFQDGLARRKHEAYIVNLNYQSVSSSVEERSLAVEALHQWTHGNSWRKCGDCDANQGCPIFANQSLLSSQSGELAIERRERINTIFSTTERLGIVVTIREMLMILAYTLTSGLSCSDVHSRFRKAKTGWQYRFIYYNNLFELSPNLKADKLQRIPVLAELLKLDPGKRASREIDERIVNEQDVFPRGQIDLQFSIITNNKTETIDAANGIDEIIGNPRNRNERVAEANFIQTIVRSLRRRAYFDAIQVETSPLELLGFFEGAKFAEIIDGSLQPKRSAELKRIVIAGLHNIQGLQFSGSSSLLNLVDPAFGDATSHAAIIADSIAVKEIELLPMAQKWALQDIDEPFAISNSVNWLDRHIVLRIHSRNGDPSDLLLDLVSFECIARAGGGFVAEEFYAHDVRRISSYLAQLAEKSGASAENITLFYEGVLRSVSIDEGIVQVSDS